MICSKKTKRLTIKSLLCKIAFIDSNGYSPPSFCHDFGSKFTLLRVTTHCALPVFLVVMRVQSSMKCIVCFVLRSSGKFKLVHVWNWSWVVVCMICQVQFIMWHCVRILFSNSQTTCTNYIYTGKSHFVPFENQTSFLKVTSDEHFKF